MKMNWDELLKEAKELGKKLGHYVYHGRFFVTSEWADAHSDLYDSFADKIEELYRQGYINEEQFNKLACTAFYDYDLK